MTWCQARSASLSRAACSFLIRFSLKALSFSPIPCLIFGQALEMEFQARLARISARAMP